MGQIPLSSRSYGKPHHIKKASKTVNFKPTISIKWGELNKQVIDGDFSKWIYQEEWEEAPLPIDPNRKDIKWKRTWITQVMVELV